MKLVIVGKRKDTGEEIGKTEFLLDDFEEDLLDQLPMEMAINYFKKKYIDPYALLCRNVSHCSAICVDVEFVECI